MGKMGRDWTGCYRPGRGVGDVRSGLPAGTRAAFARRDREGVDRDRRRRRERARRSRATTHLVTPHAPDDAPTASASAGAGSALRARLASYTPNAHHASIDATCATMTPSGNAPVSDAVTTSASSGISSIATRSGEGGVGGVGREGRGTRSALDGSTRAFRVIGSRRGAAPKKGGEAFCIRTGGVFENARRLFTASPRVNALRFHSLRRDRARAAVLPRARPPPPPPPGVSFGRSASFDPSAVRRPRGLVRLALARRESRVSEPPTRPLDDAVRVEAQAVPRGRALDAAARSPRSSSSA